MVLDEHRRAVAERVLDEESGRRQHLVVVLSGAHAYGFPSPDSDLDLKGIHAEPTSRLVSLSPPAAHAERVEVVDGVEIDYTSNEIQPALMGLLQGNGNYLERLLGALVLRASPELETLRPLARATLSRRYHRHYQGFARSQLHELEARAAATAKKVLYVLRTALTGVHLLLTGELVTDVTALLDDHGFGHARGLVEAKRAGERTVLPEDERGRWLAEVGRAFTILDEARERSPLPEEPRGREELEAWLIELRKRCW